MTAHAFRTTLVVLLSIAAVSLAGATEPTGTSPDPAVFGTFSDNTLQYSYGANFRSPFITSGSQPDGADIVRNAIGFTHVDAWRYGHNLVDVSFKRSDSVDPARGGGGAEEFYSIIRSGISINRVAGRPLVALGPLRDIDIQAGMDIQTKNTDFAPRERTLFLGPNLQLHFGSGFFNLGLQLRKEWNHNGLLSRNERYDVGFNLEPVWSIPFRIGAARLDFSGYADYNTAKGRDVYGQQTHVEFIARPQLKIDVGAAFAMAPGTLELGVAYEYWHNMYGRNASVVPGANQSALVIGLFAHWPPARHRS
jgi:nucleoside-specific outer membrane channel protein Tsx